MLTGLFATFLIPETKGRTLEGKLIPSKVLGLIMTRLLAELSNENQEGFITGGAGPLELRDGVVEHRS